MAHLHSMYIFVVCIVLPSSKGEDSAFDDNKQRFSGVACYDKLSI